MVIQVLQNVKPGQSYLKQTSFYTPSAISLSSAQILWSLVDDNYLSLSSGTGSIVTTQPYDTDQRVDVHATINIPSDVPANIMGTAYLLLWKLILLDGTIYRSQDTVTVAQDSYVLSGPLPVIGINGIVNTQLILPITYSHVSFQLYYQNTLVPTYLNPIVCTLTNTTTDGYIYTGQIDTSLLPGQSLDPYTVIWSYYNGSDLPSQEVGTLYFITPSVFAAIREMQVTVQRAINTFDNMADTTFSPDTLLDFLRTGRDNFNGFYQTTNITMLNAVGAFRSYWLACANVAALRSQYLVEALKKFDFTSSAVTLSVDHAQAFESMANQLETQYLEPLKEFKTLISKRGNINGNGNSNPGALTHGAIGAVGISISSVAQTRFLGGNSGWLGLMRL